MSSESRFTTTLVWFTKAVVFFSLAMVEIIRITEREEKKKGHNHNSPYQNCVLKYFFFKISITIPRCCLYNKILLQMLLRKQHFFNILIFFFPYPTLLSHRHFCLVFRLLKFLTSQKILLDKAGNKYFVLHNKGN